MKNIETIKKAVALLKSKHVRVISDGPTEMIETMSELNLDAYGINVGISEDTNAKCFKHNYNVCALTFKSLVDLVWYIQPRNINESYFENLFGSFRCSKYVIVSPVQEDLEYWTMLFKNKGFHYNENLTNKLGDGCLVFGNNAEVAAPPSEDWKELEKVIHEAAIMPVPVEQDRDELLYTANFDVELIEDINIKLAEAEDAIIDAAQAPLNPKSGQPIKANQKIIAGKVVTYNKDGSIRKKPGPKTKNNE